MARLSILLWLILVALSGCAENGPGDDEVATCPADSEEEGRAEEEARAWAFEAQERGPYPPSGHLLPSQLPPPLLQFLEQLTGVDPRLDSNFVRALERMAPKRASSGYHRKNLDDGPDGRPDGGDDVGEMPRMA